MSENGAFTVGDVGVDIGVLANESLVGATVYIIFIKPSRKTLKVLATSVDDMTAYYTWAEGDLDESGDWGASLEKISGETHYEYQPGAGSFYVRPKTEDLAK